MIPDYFEVLIIKDAEIARLEVKGTDMFWTYGVFVPLPQFEKYKSIFEQLESAIKEDRDDFVEILEIVNKLELKIKNKLGVYSVKDFKIVNEEFEYKST